MTADEFRSLALSLPEAMESSHMDHPDFRVRKKIFATLGYPDATCGMVRLTAPQQAEFVAAAPQVFKPVSGGWGRGGATTVMLAAAKEAVVRRTLIAAWRNTAPKKLAAQLEDD